MGIPTIERLLQIATITLLAVRRVAFTRRNVGAGLSKQRMIISSVTGARGKVRPTKQSANRPS